MSTESLKCRFGRRHEQAAILRGVAHAGHGYAAVNRLGGWRSDHDIFQTFEGDNTVLLQQTAGATNVTLQYMSSA